MSKPINERIDFGTLAKKPATEQPVPYPTTYVGILSTPLPGQSFLVIHADEPGQIYDRITHEYEIVSELPTRRTFQNNCYRIRLGESSTRYVMKFSHLPKEAIGAIYAELHIHKAIDL